VRVAEWTIVVPVKGTASAKSRLGASAELALAIALDSVSAALGHRVLVVTSPRSASPFELLGARIVPDPGGGLNAAIAAGLATAGVAPVAVLLGDVPALLPSELAVALDLAAGHRMAMVADADGTGTVLTTALEGASHRPLFGAGSRAAHLSAGYVELDVPPDSGLRRDVDTAEQLVALGGRVGPRTQAALGF
jgi:2-phospho-L-lactate guanylyltransferase